MLKLVTYFGSQCRPVWQQLNNSGKVCAQKQHSGLAYFGILYSNFIMRHLALSSNRAPQSYRTESLHNAGISSDSCCAQRNGTAVYLLKQITDKINLTKFPILQLHLAERKAEVLHRCTIRFCQGCHEVFY
jgi:hypothetical protein